jgi:chitodextrinase
MRVRRLPSRAAMTALTVSKYAARLAVVTCVLTLMSGSSMLSAQGRDRTPPTTPKNLRVTAMTPYSVTLAWDPSTDNSGSFTYQVCCANVSSETFPGGGSTHVYRNGLESGRTFTLFMIAKDAAGNYSKQSNTVTFRLPVDKIPPVKPSVSVTDVGPTHASISFSSTEEGPVWFSVFVNGAPIINYSRDRTATLYLLEPQTTYNVTVRARDFGGNQSPPSDPIAITTAAPNPNDVTPPTRPANLGFDSWGDAEIALRWDQSVDDFDPQWIIRYDVEVNGVLSDITVGRGRSIVYGELGRINTITVVAIDTAGNRSGVATILVPL